MKHGNAIYNLNLPATDERISDDLKNHHVGLALLDLLPKDMKDLLGKIRMSNWTLAEYIIAHAKKTKAVHQGVGLDFTNGSEGKFAVVEGRIQKCVKNKKEYFYEKFIARFSNLKNKTGDLHLIVADARVTGTVKLRFFSFPVDVWKSKISSNDFSLDLTLNTHKWYMDYEVDQKQFGL